MISYFSICQGKLYYILKSTQAASRVDELENIEFVVLPLAQINSCAHDQREGEPKTGWTPG